MKILFILTLCFYINVEAQCKSNKSIYGNAISVLYEKLLKDEVLEKTDTLYLILDEKANLNKEQDKISKNISLKFLFWDWEKVHLYIRWIHTLFIKRIG